jgi:hypothetical protein
LAKARTRFVLSALLVLAAASVGGLSARAQDNKDNCLPAPTGKAPPGSHWHYRTDPVKQTKCWYVRSDGEAAQPTAATDGADVAGGPPRPAAAPKPATDAANSAAHPHKPRQAAHAAPGGKPSQPAQNPAAAQAGQGAAAWPDPQPQSPNGTSAAPQAPQSGAAWPDPPQQSQSGAGNVPWPDPPGSGAAADPATTSATSDGSSVQDTGSTNPTGAGETAAEAVQTPPASGSDVSGRTILALAIAIIFVAILMRWLVGRFFARRRRVAAERREPLWETDDYVMPDALTRGGPHRAPDHIDPERLNAEAKLALRKLLRTLERSAA